jgi:hypothetical protein
MPRISGGLMGAVGDGGILVDLCESGDVPEDRPPYGRTPLRVAAIGGVVLLTLSGLIVWWVTPTVDRSLDCDSVWSVLSVVGAILAVIVGATVALVTLFEVIRARAWSALPIVFAAVALVVCGIAAGYLYAQTWGSEYCETS